MVTFQSQFHQACDESKKLSPDFLLLKFTFFLLQFPVGIETEVCTSNAFWTAPTVFSFPEHSPESQPTEHGSLPPTVPRRNINTGRTLEPVSQGNFIWWFVTFYLLLFLADVDFKYLLFYGILNSPSCNSSCNFAKKFISQSTYSSWKFPTWCSK